MERLHDGLDARERRVLALRLDGHTAEEIARATGSTGRAVFRQLDRIRQRLAALDPPRREPDAPPGA